MVGSLPVSLDLGLATLTCIVIATLTAVGDPKIRLTNYRDRVTLGLQSLHTHSES